jgi:hypothetical protein
MRVTESPCFEVAPHQYGVPSPDASMLGTGEHTDRILALLRASNWECISAGVD